MSTNKQVVEAYSGGFRSGDHTLVISCLTDNVENRQGGFMKLVFCVFELRTVNRKTHFLSGGNQVISPPPARRNRTGCHS